jgi:hypothetical protein
MVFLFFLTLIGKRHRLVLVLLALELLLLGLLLYFLALGSFYFFFLIGILGVVSSIACLVFFLKVVVALGHDLVFF